MTQKDIIEHVIKSEGGAAINYNEGPVHGVSKYGVTMVTLAEYRKVSQVTREDVFNLELDEAIAIFKKNFWDKMALDFLSATPYIQAMLFDQGLNRGPNSVSKQFCTFLNYRFKTTFPETTKITPEIGAYVATLDQGYFTRELLAECQIQYNKLMINAWKRLKESPPEMLEENERKLENVLKNINGWTIRLKSLSHFLASEV